MPEVRLCPISDDEFADLAWSYLPARSPNKITIIMAEFGLDSEEGTSLVEFERFGCHLTNQCSACLVLVLQLLTEKGEVWGQFRSASDFHLKIAVSNCEEELVPSSIADPLHLHC